MKKENKQKLMYRLDRALRDMYHNAKNQYWSYGDDFFELFWDNYCDNAEVERHMCDDTPISDIVAEFGKVYTWGRSGGTLAPEKLINVRGGSNFSIKKAEDFEEININDILRYIELIENFNEYVTEWNSKENQRILWKEYLAYKINDDFLPEAESLRKKIIGLAREAKQLKNSGNKICGIMTEKIHELYQERKELIKKIQAFNVEKQTC